jgi:hypothetical protein
MPTKEEISCMSNVGSKVGILPAIGDKIEVASGLVSIGEVETLAV